MHNLPHRILSQKVGDHFEAWFFDGENQRGKMETGTTREEAIKKLQERKK